MYYNPKTNTTLDYYDLKNKLNASIPYNVEVVESGDDPDNYWYLIHEGEKPEYNSETQTVELIDTVRQIGDKYYNTYQARDLTESELEEKQHEKLQQAKEERSTEVANIRVIVDNMEFDGDEVAQDRMSRVASIAGANELDTVLPWVLADNTVANVTVAQIKEALRKALYAQAELWVKPYISDIEKESGNKENSGNVDIESKNVNNESENIDNKESE